MSRFSFDKKIKLSIVKFIEEEDFALKWSSKEFNINANLVQAYVKYGGRAFLCK